MKLYKSILLSINFFIVTLMLIFGIEYFTLIFPVKLLAKNPSLKESI